MAKQPEEILYSAADVRRMKKTLVDLNYYLGIEETRTKKNKGRIASLKEEIKKIKYSISGKN
jgi:hypothetical protein